jgi:D-alanine-D-alanine ligase
MRIAFLYNIRHLYPDPKNQKSQKEADFDDPKTIKTILGYLKKCGYDVLPIEADENAYKKLKTAKNRIDLAFNYSMGNRGKERNALFPAMLEILGIPYTGPGVLTQALILNKAKSKDMMRSFGIPVVIHQLFKNGDKISPELHFPLIVKPVAQGSSAGITNKSVVRTERELRRQVKLVFETFNDNAIVEPFLEGREFSVPMLGNPPVILPIIESDHSKLPKGYEKIDSLEVKWIFEEKHADNNLSCPAKIDKILEKKIKNICLKVWSALDIKDICRIDIRCDRKGNPYVLEVNSPPGLIPPELSQSYFPYSAGVAGIEYKDLLKKIIESAKERYKNG